MIARLLDCRKSGWLSAGFSLARSACAGYVCEAPLAAGVIDGIRGGVALVPALLITAAGGGCQVLSTAAEEALHQVAEQVTSKKHVDPRVAAAVETGQQHGNDKGHVYKKRHREEQIIHIKNRRKKKKNLEGQVKSFYIFYSMSKRKPKII